MKEAKDSGGMFVLEPEASFHVNLTEFLRISWGLSYRLGVPFDPKAVLKTTDLSGIAAGIRVQFGRFD